MGNRSRSRLSLSDSTGSSISSGPLSHAGQGKHARKHCCGATMALVGLLRAIANSSTGLWVSGASKKPTFKQKGNLRALTAAPRLPGPWWWGSKHQPHQQRPGAAGAPPQAGFNISLPLPSHPPEIRWLQMMLSNTLRSENITLLLVAIYIVFL